MGAFWGWLMQSTRWRITDQLRKRWVSVLVREAVAKPALESPLTSWQFNVTGVHLLNQSLGQNNRLV